MPSDDTEGWKHGIYGYKRRGCRCEVCRAAKARQQARYRARHPLRTRPRHAALPTPPPQRLVSDPPPKGLPVQPTLCLEWDCERPAGPSGYCAGHAVR